MVKSFCQWHAMFWFRNLGYLLESIIILEFGLTIRRYVWQYKLLLAHLYFYWNSLPLAYERTVIEFVQFKERLQCSNQYLMAKIEAAILQLKQNSNNIDEAESILESSKFGTHFLELSNEIRIKPLTLNEDLKLRPWWTPTNDKNYLLGAVEGVSYCPTASMKSWLFAGVYHNFGVWFDYPEICVAVQAFVGPSVFLLEFSSVSFRMVIEFVQFKERLKCSNQYLMAKIETAILQLKQNSNNIDEAEEPLKSVLLSYSKHGTKTEAPTSGTWHIVNSLLRKSIIEKINSAGPVVSSPGATLPFLGQLITEPLSWHGLIVQSCVRSLVPSWKNKKKGGSTEQSNSQISYMLQNSIQFLCDTIQIIVKWLKEQLDKPEDENFEAILSTIQDQNSNVPGKVFQVLESSLSLMKDADLEERILESLNSWIVADIPRKIISGQHGLLSEFLRICELKIKSLQELSMNL